MSKLPQFTFRWAQERVQFSFLNRRHPSLLSHKNHGLLKASRSFLISLNKLTITFNLFKLIHLNLKLVIPQPLLAKKIKKLITVEPVPIKIWWAGNLYLRNLRRRVVQLWAVRYMAMYQKEQQVPQHSSNQAAPYPLTPPYSAQWPKNQQSHHQKLHKFRNRCQYLPKDSIGGIQRICPILIIDLYCRVFIVVLSTFDN